MFLLVYDPSAFSFQQVDLKCLYLSGCVCAVLSHQVMSDSLQPRGLQPARLLCPWGFSRQEYWSGLPCLPPGDLPNSGIKLSSPALQENLLPTEPPGKPRGCVCLSRFQGSGLSCNLSSLRGLRVVIALQFFQLFILFLKKLFGYNRS